MKKISKKEINEWRERLKKLTPVMKGPGGRGFRKKAKKNEWIQPLTDHLQSYFWPDYEYIESKFRIKGESGLKNPQEGIVRGKLVHQQLEDYGNRKSTAQFIKENPILHPYTKHAIAFIKEYGLTPIMGEYSVCDSTLSIATNIDMILLDDQRRIYLFEWKTGMNGYFERGSGKMRSELSGFYNNCPKHQALIQLLFSKLFFEQTTGLKVYHSFVVHLNEITVAHTCLEYEIEMIQRTELLYDQFLRFVLNYIESEKQRRKFEKESKKKPPSQKRLGVKKQIIKNKKKKSNLF